MSTAAATQWLRTNVLCCSVPSLFGEGIPVTAAQIHSAYFSHLTHKDTESHKILHAHIHIYSRCLHTHGTAAAFTQHIKSLRESKGSCRASEGQLCLSKIAWHQLLNSSPAGLTLPNPHTLSESGSSPLSSCLSLSLPLSFLAIVEFLSFHERFHTKTFNLLLFPLLPPLSPEFSTLVAREGFWSPAPENTICSHCLRQAIRPVVWFPTGSQADRRIQWLLFMFLVKNTGRKRRGKMENKWYFCCPSKANCPSIKWDQRPVEVFCSSPGLSCGAT